MIFSVRGVFFTIAAILLMPFAVAAQPVYEEPFSGTSLSAGWLPSDNYAINYPGDVANHAVFGMTGSQLSISFPAGADHNMWEVQHAQVARPFLGSGTYETKVDSAFTGVQEVGLIFQSADRRTFMIFMLLSYLNDQAKAYVERFSYVDGVLHKQTFQGGGIGRYIPAPGPYYIRVTVEDSVHPQLRTWRFQWSDNGSTWVNLVEGGLESMEPSQNIGAIQSVGVFAGNGPQVLHVQPPVFDGYDARFDYFRFSSPGVAPPSDLVARATDGRVDLWWEPLGGADGYNVYGSTVAGGPYTQLGTTSAPSFSHAGVANGTHRYYIVKAHKSGFEGSASAEVEAVPHAQGALATLPQNGLALLLSASELAYTHAGGDPVEVWPTALTGNSVAFSQGGSPTFISSGLNGQPVVRFDGVADHMGLSGTFQNFTQGVSVYVVAKPATVTSGFKYLLLGNGPSWDGIGLGNDVPGSGFQYFAFNQWGGVGWFTTTTGVVASEPSLVSLIQDSGAAGSSSYAEIAKNGVPLYGSMVDVPSVASRTLNYIGKSYWGDAPFHGDIAEIIVYNRKLDAAEQAAVRSYVAGKYNLPIDGNPGAPQPLVAPTSLVAVGGDNSVALTWASVAGATSYRVHRTGPSQPATEIAVVSAASYTDTTVVNGFAYSYTVTAHNAQSVSPHSSAVAVTPTAPPQPPVGVPTNGLVLSLDAATALQDVGNLQPVTVWRDSSTSSHNATSTGNSPVVVANALNGKPVVRFDGVNDFLTLASGFQDFSAGTTLYMVMRPSSPKSSKIMVLGNGRDVDNIGFHGWPSGGLLYFIASGSGMSWFESGPALATGEASLLSVIQQPAAGGYGYTEIGENGAALSGQNLFSPPQVVRSQNFIGYSHWGEGTFHGDIAEILLYNRTLTSAEQTAVRQYLGDKYGITAQ